ncbi:carboxylesterase/lipase family protein [Streptomyces sp. NBC_01304]|uniref:carboxylesterase/lipase family protein n=1 Tax=Streptomyces sp. NBC_01304 TaxID=2903818 RepID=UPI002E140348|nr:carboxylesterase family protein [Streptomyces sp. NBC_01304]
MLKRTAHTAIALSLATVAAVTLTAGSTSSAVAADGQRTDSQKVVRTDKGAVRGTVTDAVRTFEGIPYAAPPTGDRRWAPTAPAAGWRGVRDAREPGAACPQTGFVPPVGPYSDIEDCLSLNVTTPRTTSAGPRPVMVYLHGGDHTDGSGAMNGAARLAAQGDVVVVTVNYRLGALGYLAHPDLEKKGRGESGNYGFLDQQAALRWVQRNAAAFGGDPGNVTLFGESGGGHSTCAHLVAPSSAGLFHRVVTQSAPCLGKDGKLDRAHALKQGEQTARAITEKVAGQGKDWRTAGAKDMVNPFGQGPEYAPVYGGKLLPLKPQEAFATGQFNKVPVLQGINHDESRAMVYGQELFKRQQTNDPDAQISEAEYRAGLEAEFGPERAPAIAARYPVSAYDGSPALALAAALTDGTWARHSVETGRALATQVPTYSFEFNDSDTPWYRDHAAYPKPSFEPGAGHLSELPYLFELAEFESVPDGPHRALSDAMIRIWTEFARTGRADWKPTTPTAPNVQSLASGPGGIRPVDFAKDHRYEFWKALGA